MGALASGVAVVHGLAVLFMLTGALLAVRWPRLVLVHAPVALAILAVNLAGADCPLTDLEVALRGDAGYEGGFLGHYLLGPLGLDERATGTQVGISWGPPRAPAVLQDPTSARNTPAAR